MKTEIRPARLSEAAELSAMMRRTFLAANGHCSTPENVAAFVAQAYTPERQAQEIRDPDTLTLIVEQDGVWAGFAQLRWGTLPPTDVGLQPTVELARIYLDEAFHGRGIGFGHCLQISWLCSGAYRMQSFSQSDEEWHGRYGARNWHGRASNCRSRWCSRW